MILGRKCKLCGEVLIGRTDKIFCSDQCRNTFNSKIKRESEKTIIHINKILRRNRKILKQFNPEGKTTIRREFLVKLGFEFNFHTHTRTTVNENTYMFCYEYGFLELPNEKVLIVNQQEYWK